MTFNNNAFYLPPLMEQIWDKTLNVPLAGGIVKFFRDDARTTPKDVYELTGTGPGSYTYVNIGSELTLSGIGTFVDSSGGNLQVFLWPFTGSPNDTPPSTTAQPYYITVESSTFVFQFDVPNWPPGIGSGNTPVTTSNTTDNVLANDQFVDVSFPTNATVGNPWQLTVSGTGAVTPIAPDWSVITTGSGTISLYKSTNADDTAPGNPATALGISTSGFAAPIILRQRINNPRIFAGQYVSATFIAESSGSAYTVTMNYTSSITGTIIPLCSGTTLTSGYTRIFNSSAVLIPDPGGGVGTVDITLVFPANASFLFSCVQLCGVAGSTDAENYLQQTPERIEDHLFHYWNPRLQFKPTPSLLTGWDFILNPFQFAKPSTLTTTPAYLCDQTIGACSKSTVTFAIDVPTGNLIFQTNAATQGFYILQYLSGDSALEVMNTYVSSLVTAYNPNGTGGVVNVYLFYSNGGGSIPSLPSTIGTINDAGVFTLTASGWAQITQFTPTGPYKLNSDPDRNRTFNGFNTAQYWGSNSTANFAIVVTFSVPTSGTPINVLSVSLNKGLIATHPAPQSVDEVLRECQYYYRKSFLPGTVPANNVGKDTGETYFVQTVADALLNLGPIVAFPTPMRTTPSTPTLYNPLPIAGGAGAASQIADITNVQDWSLCSVSAITANGFYTLGTAHSGSVVGAVCGVHWTADARLGVV